MTESRAKQGSYKGYPIRDYPFAPARHPPSPTTERFENARSLVLKRTAPDYVGISADGTVRPDLFPVQHTGVETGPLVAAATRFLATLSESQRAAVSFPIDTPQWRQWLNWYPFVVRHGLLLEQLEPAQRDAALALMRECMGGRGFEAARDMMRVNENLAELTGRFDEFGEWIYWISIMGTPSGDQPWGWQVDGHHLNINYFVLGDQVVMSPVFMGAEPLKIEEGKYAGENVETFQVEERRGLDLVRSLSAAQRAEAILFPSAFPRDLPPDRLHGTDTHICAGAFNDNLVLPYEGVRADSFTPGQRELMLGLLDSYIGLIRPGHSRVKMDEIERHLGDLRFAWIGGTGDEDIFYYRVHSPVVLIEFDHHPGYGFVSEDPYKMHVHTMVRTPNGNDYGKALLKNYRASRG
jgi:hypothetical protein